MVVAQVDIAMTIKKTIYCAGLVFMWHYALLKSVSSTYLHPLSAPHPTDPVCRPEAGVQQAPLQDRPALPVPLHLPVLHRQLQLRYTNTPSSYCSISTTYRTHTSKYDLFPLCCFMTLKIKKVFHLEEKVAVILTLLMPQFMWNWGLCERISCWWSAGASRGRGGKYWVCLKLNWIPSPIHNDVREMCKCWFNPHKNWCVKITRWSSTGG